MNSRLPSSNSLGLVPLRDPLSPAYSVKVNITKKTTALNRLVKADLTFEKLCFRILPKPDMNCFPAGIHARPGTEKQPLFPRKIPQMKQKQIARLVYDLYGRTEAERQMVEGRRIGEEIFSTPPPRPV